MSRSRIFRLGVATCLCLLASGAFAQEDDNRPSMTLNEAGQVLRFVGGDSDDPTAVLESGGSTTEILAYGDVLQGEGVRGFGNLADLNDAGVAVMKVSTAREVDTRCHTGCVFPSENEFLVTSDQGAPPVVLAVATRDGSGTAFGDRVLCQIGPMPEINNSGAVAWFGAIAPDDSVVFECGGFDRDPTGGDSYNPSFLNNQTSRSDQVDSYFLANEDETTLSVNDGATGTFVAIGDYVNSAVFRYAPGGGHTVLLEGNYFGKADTLTVSNPNFVASPTEYKVREVDYIRDGSQRMNGAGDFVAHLEIYDGPAGSGTYDNCTAIVNLILDNPYDDPDNDEPYVRYGNINCPGFRGTVVAEDALVLFRGTSQTVVAATGPDSVYSQIADEGALVNASGQVVFRAENQAGDAMIELFTPGVGWQTIAMEGDPLPTAGSSHFFCDFPPHYDLADDGSLAFQAEIGACGDAPRGGTPGDGETALFYYSDGQLRELFRTDDMAEVGVNVPSQWDGRPIGELSSVAIVPTSGLVQFFVENWDYEPSACQPKEERGASFGDGEWTALLSWTERNGLEAVMAEGDSLGGDAVIHRIYAMGPKLRAHANSNAELVALIDIDQDGDCSLDDNDPEVATQVLLLGRGTPPLSSILEIPIAGPIGLGIFATALLLLSLSWVRSRGMSV